MLLEAAWHPRLHPRDRLAAPAWLSAATCPSPPTRERLKSTSIRPFARPRSLESQVAGLHDSGAWKTSRRSLALPRLIRIRSVRFGGNGEMPFSSHSRRLVSTVRCRSSACGLHITGSTSHGMPHLDKVIGTHRDQGACGRRLCRPAVSWLCSAAVPALCGCQARHPAWR